MQVPAFLLRRLYVKGSLRHEDGGSCSTYTMRSARATPIARSH